MHVCSHTEDGMPACNRCENPLAVRLMPQVEMQVASIRGLDHTPNKFTPKTSRLLKQAMRANQTERFHAQKTRFNGRRTRVPSPDYFLYTARA